jgi:hypothetical protein
MDKDVKRWHDNLARGSKVNADICFRRLGHFCKKHGLTPREFMQKDDEELSNILLDYVTGAEENGYAGSYIKSTLTALKSWLAHNRREVKVKIKIKGVDDAPSLKNERVPTKGEPKRIFLSGDKKAKTACVLVAHSGLRIKTIGNYIGNDGLRVKDFPELRIEREYVNIGIGYQMVGKRIFDFWNNFEWHNMHPEGREAKPSEAAPTRIFLTKLQQLNYLLETKDKRCELVKEKLVQDIKSLPYDSITIRENE